MKIGKQCKIVKATYDKLVGAIFEYVIINKGMAPKWFQEFVENEFKPMANKVNRIENRLDNVIKKNSLKE